MLYTNVYIQTHILFSQEHAAQRRGELGIAARCGGDPRIFTVLYAFSLFYTHFHYFIRIFTILYAFFTILQAYFTRITRTHAHRTHVMYCTRMFYAHHAHLGTLYALTRERVRA